MRDLNLKGNHFPISKAFLIFLAKEFGGATEYDDTIYWGDQHLETNQPPLNTQNLNNVISSIKDKDVVKFLINKAHHIAGNLLISNKELIDSLQNNYKFYLIVSPPRSGGTYITKNLYKSLGINPKLLPSFFGHDGFPSVNQEWYKKNSNGYINFVQSTVWQFSEWLTMADYYLPKIIDNSGKRVIIIKIIKSHNNLNFFRSLLGGNACFILNKRSIIDLYFSVIDKAGGIDNNDISTNPRNNIESWIINEYLSQKHNVNNIKESYIEILGRYYYSFYMRILSGGFRNGDNKIVNYDKSSIYDVCKSIICTYNNDLLSLEKFIVNDYSARYNEELVNVAQNYDDKINSLFQFFD